MPGGRPARTRMAGRPGALWSTFRKDRLTEEYLRSLGLNDRQVQAILYVKDKGRITHGEYRQLFQ